MIIQKINHCNSGRKKLSHLSHFSIQHYDMAIHIIVFPFYLHSSLNQETKIILLLGYPAGARGGINMCKHTISHLIECKTNGRGEVDETDMCVSQCIIKAIIIIRLDTSTQPNATPAVEAYMGSFTPLHQFSIHWISPNTDKSHTLMWIYFRVLLVSLMWYGRDWAICKVRYLHYLACSKFIFLQTKCRAHNCTKHSNQQP